MRHFALLLCLAPITACGGSGHSSPHAAEVTVSAVQPEMTCGDRRGVELTFVNAGTSTWTSAGGFALLATADSFADVAQIALAETDEIAPGDSVTFALAIRAPGDAGTHTSEWRMAKDGDAFGDAASWTVEVGCNRTPDPAEGEALPLPDMRALVQEVAASDPTLIAESCQDDGGNWRFLDTLVDRLRKVDTRWGYNWKRGVVGDPSKDVVDYHYSAGADEDSQDVYIIDVLIGHCGPDPAPGWTDVTQATLDGGTIGVWTGRERF